MATYKGDTNASDISNTDASDKIPIYHRDTESGNEMITGYLSKKKCKNPQSFFGHFKCEECGNTWTSSNTLQGCRQSCDKCSCPNWPFKVYHLELAEKSFDKCRETKDDDDDDDDDDDYDAYDYDDDDDDYDDDDDVNNHKKIYDYDYGYDDYSSDDDDDDDDDSKEITIYLQIQIIGCVGKELITGYLSKEKIRGRWRGKRFYGYFRCKICGNTWTSHNIWQGYKQECKECVNNVAYWPYIVYHLEQLKKKKDNQKLNHITDLCEKCKELGYNCRADDTIGLRIIQPNKFYGQGFKKQFDLFSHDIRLEIKFIQEFYLLVLPLLLENRDEMNEFNEALIFCINKWQVQGNSIMVEEFLNILEKQFEFCDTNKTLEPKFINEYYEIMWPRFSIEKKKAFKIALKSIMKKCKKRKSKEMLKACRNVLKKIKAKK